MGLDNEEVDFLKVKAGQQQSRLLILVEVGLPYAGDVLIVYSCTGVCVLSR